MGKNDNNEKPVFSIITCTFNSQEFLADNISSVQSQTFGDFEHIFVDAFSSDNTINLVQAYKTRYPDRVRFFQQPAGGVSAAMNFGLSQAKGDVILFLHSDDYLSKANVLAKVAAVFLAPNIPMVVGNCQLVAQGKVVGSSWPQNKFYRFLMRTFYKSFLFFINSIPHPSVYVRRQVFEQNGYFDEQLKTVMDYDYWFRIFKKVRPSFLDEILSVYRFHPKTISTMQVQRAKQEVLQLVHKYRKDYFFEYVFFFLIMKPLIFLRRVLKP